MPAEFWRSEEGRKLIAAIMLALALGAAGCGDDGNGNAAGTTVEAPDTSVRGTEVGVGEVDREFVGTVDEDDNIYVSVARLTVDGREVAMVYLCDGESVAQIFFGTIESGKAETGSLRGAEITVTFDGTTATGSGTLADGTEVNFSADEVDSDGAAGVYLALDEDVDTFGDRDYGAWIVLPDGSQRGATVLNGVVSSGGVLDPASGIVSIASGQVPTRTTGFICMHPD